MIEAFSLSTAHLFQDALASQARLRHRVFVEGRRLPHPSFDGMEYDEFDTPAAVYLVWRDPDLVVRGLVRLLPTTRPYMLRSCWPHLVEDGDLPSSADVWEITRVCVDRSVEPSIRRKILPELLCGAGEYFEAHGVRTMVGVTRPHLVEHFIRTGVRWLGKPDMIEGEMERAFMVGREHIRPERHCERYGISGRVLEMAKPLRLAA
ncbi:MAG TPA: acyl-homoserine-lactone synthase [Beijerinckiaceae bacterium]|jgi:acyl homoserine lactone synthase